MTGCGDGSMEHSKVKMCLKMGIYKWIMSDNHVVYRFTHYQNECDVLMRSSDLTQMIEEWESHANCLFF